MSSVAPSNGVRGKAIKPVRADSKMPKGEMSFMKASIRGGFAELRHTDTDTTRTLAVEISRGERGKKGCHGKKPLQLDDAIICADVQHLPAKLMRQMRNVIQMLILVPQRLTGRQPARMVIGV